jgi:hypothetical protein
MAAVKSEGISLEFTEHSGITYTSNPVNICKLAWVVRLNRFRANI